MKFSKKRSQYDGFTLFECLLSLFLFTLICLLSTGYLKHAQLLTERLSNTSEKEWHIFLIQFENEVRDLQFVSASKDQLLFQHQEADYPVIIEFKRNKIIKSANGGYQPLLIHVESAEFRRQGKQLELEVMFQNKKNKVGRFTF